jgi:hypothetical protein
MKTLWLASCLLVPAFSFAATGGDERGTQAADGSGSAKTDCPASALIAKWQKAAEQIAAMPAETRAVVARAHATLSASCPVCQEAPAAFAFLGRFFDATVALDGRILAACEEGARTGAWEAPPAEIQSAFAERVAIGAKARELYAAFTLATTPTEQAHCTQAAAVAQRSDPEATPASALPSPTFAAVGREFDSLREEARRVASSWNAVPARAAALPAETKAELLAAMELLKREVPTCELALETMSVLGQSLDRLVALDQTLADHCRATSKEEHAELPVELAQMKAAAEARTRTTASVAELLRVMKKAMTPDVFQARPEPAVAGAGR